jgi:hypothetical protein
LTEDLQSALGRLVGRMSWDEGKAIMRIGAVLRSRSEPASYGRDRGRARFQRELGEDGLDADVIEEALAAVDRALESDDVSLDDVLDGLRQRWRAS